MPLRIGIIMDHPSPHMVALLDALAERDDCVGEVFYLGKVAPERRWGAPLGRLPYRFLNGMALKTGGLRINTGLTDVLRQKKVDIWLLNTVYSAPSTLIAAWVLSHGSTPWIYMNEPPRPRSRALLTFKLVPFKFVIRRASGIIGMGKKAVDIYRSFLDGDRPMTSIPYYIDLEKFFQLPIPDGPRDGGPLQFLVCGQMIHRKGLDILLHACEKLKNLNWQLTLVGDGPLRRTLQREFARRFPPGRVIFKGEIPYDQRPEAFAGQHIFVFPSRWDGWGMVVVEAMAAGLPVLTTDQVIAAHEFVTSGVNGFVIPANDSMALAERIAYFIRNPDKISPMATAARQTLKNYRPESGAERLAHFLNRIVQNVPCSPKRITRESPEGILNWQALTKPGSVPKSVRRSIRALAKGIFIRTGNVIRPNAKPNGHRILVYHLVLKEDRKSFEEQIGFLKDHFEMGLVSRILKSLNCPGDDHTYRAAITFDDGFRVLMDDCLEILEKFRIKASFFVPTSFIELSNRPEEAARFSLRAHYYNQPLEPMQPKDLQALIRSGHEVGSHGLSHISIRAMSVAQAIRELNLSRERILEWTGVEPAGFAYPYGHTSHVLGDPAEWVRQAGYSFGVTLNRGAISSGSNPFRLPREHAEGNWSVRELKFFLRS